MKEAVGATWVLICDLSEFKNARQFQQIKNNTVATARTMPCANRHSLSLNIFQTYLGLACCRKVITRASDIMRCCYFV